MIVSEDTRAAATTAAAVEFAAEGSVELRGITGDVELFSVLARG